MTSDLHRQSGFVYCFYKRFCRVIRADVMQGRKKHTTRNPLDKQFSDCQEGGGMEMKMLWWEDVNMLAYAISEQITSNMLSFSPTLH